MDWSAYVDLSLDMAQVIWAVGLGLGLDCLCVIFACYFVTDGLVYLIGCSFVCVLLVAVGLVISASAVDCVSTMICYVSSVRLPRGSNCPIHAMSQC